MLISNTSERLRQIMNERGLRQADILEQASYYCEKYNVRMNRSDISQYLSGKVIPSQRKLSVLSKALGVQEPWLMGYDVPMKPEMENVTVRKPESQQAVDLTISSENKDTTSSLIDQLAKEHNLGTSGKALLTVALDTLTSLDEETSSMLMDRLFEKICEMKAEQSAVDPESYVVDDLSSSDPQESCNK